jgi:ubiquinone/menaquinone biosynthesis C-methylase UbiE
MTDQSAFFDERAASWDAREGAPDLGSLRRVVSEARLERGHRVLDVGTGTGVLVPLILEHISADGMVVAVDVSQRMLSQASAKTSADNVLFVAGDIHHLPAPDGAYDAEICNAAFPHFEDPLESLREMIRALRPGGVLVISHPIGREAVNARHRAAGGAVHRHQVPTPHMMRRLLSEVGTEEIAVLDEADFYLARCRKPHAHA